MRYASLAAAALAGVMAAPIQAAPPEASRAPIKLSCTGPAAAAARKIAIREKLALAVDPKACLAQTSMYGGGSKQIVAAAPSATCGRRKAIQIYEGLQAARGATFSKIRCAARASRSALIIPGARS